jgi:hypothetical protein
MDGIQTVLINAINKLKCDEDGMIFNVILRTPSEPTTYPRGDAYLRLGNTAVK